MITFKSYITEARVTDPAQLINDIKRHIKIGEILKPAFNDLKYDIDHAVENDFHSLDGYWHGKGDENYKIHEALGELTYKLPDNLHGVKSLGSFLKKYTINHPFWKAAVALQKKWEPVYNDWQTLKGMVVTTTQKRAEKKEAETKVRTKQYNDATSLVGALMQHLEAFKKRAGEMATNHYLDTMEKLKAVDGDLDKIAPEPNFRMTRTQYQMAQQKRQMYMRMSERKYPDDITKKNFFKPTRAKLDQYVQMNVDAAHQDYMAWIQKMIAKIGKPVQRAHITGDPWTGSNLTVTTSDGEEQFWTTHMIINYSKYNKAFNQFPSRRRK